MAWDNGIRPVPARLSLLSALRLTYRAPLFAALTLVMTITFLLFRMLEYPLHHRYLTTPVVRVWGRLGLFVCGLRLETVGEPMHHGGALVANHASWLDIFVLHAVAKVFFVAKAEVGKWPVIGSLAKLTGTMFIERRATEAKRQQQALLERMARGHRLCFFPEGTSTDGRRVLDFKSTLFAAFLTPELIEHVWVQPVTVTYIPDAALEPTFYGWWADMSFGGHVIAILAHSRRGVVRVTLHPPMPAHDHADRKDMARTCTEIVRNGLAQDLGLDSSAIAR